MGKMCLRDDITKAIAEAGIEGFAFVRLTRWEAILHEIADRFLKGGTSDLRYVWLWSEFREEISAFRPSSELAIDYLRGQLEPATSYWFLASDEHGKYWVAEATGEAIVRLIGEMYGFEYYVVDRQFERILCENHHGIFIKAVA